MENYKELLEKMIELTKSEKISWNYLDSNKVVCDSMKFEGVSPLNHRKGIIALASAVSDKKIFDSDNSFVSKINHNYIILYCNLNDAEDGKTLDERLMLMLVPRTFKDIKIYFSEGSDGTLLRLHTLVKSTFPSANDIENDILQMFEVL